MISCPHLRDNQFCGVAEELSGMKDVMVKEHHCQICQISKPAMAPNNMTAVLARVRAEQLGKLEEVMPKIEHLIPRKSPNIKNLSPPENTTMLSGPDLSEGTGNELHKILDKIGFEISPTCKCQLRIRTMNLRGPGWCQDNITTIVGWLREEFEERAKKLKNVLASKQDRNVPLTVADRMLLVPWNPITEYTVRIWVSIAIRRARKKRQRVRIG